MAQFGRLTRHLDADSLNRILSGMYKHEKITLKKVFNSLRKYLRRKAVTRDEQ